MRIEPDIPIKVTNKRLLFIHTSKSGQDTSLKKRAPQAERKLDLFLEGKRFKREVKGRKKNFPGR
jgi:hypothetical protein